MTIQEQPLTESANDSKTKNTIVAGLTLIVIGLVALAVQFIDSPDLGLLVLPTLAIIFLAWGLITRTFGFIIPGGILAGIGLGATLVESNLTSQHDLMQGGVFLLALAGGWALITLLSVFTTDHLQWWPLILGGITAIIGALLLAGETGLKVLELSEYLWPIALIVVGFAIILRRYSYSS